MTRIVVLLTFKAVHSRRSPLASTWKNKYRNDAGDAWIFAAVALIMASPVVCVLLGIVCLPLLQADNGDVWVARAQYALFLVPVAAFSCAELESKYRMNRVPLVILPEIAAAGGYDYSQWDLPGNPRLLLMADLIGVVVGLMLAYWAPTVLGRL